MIVPPKHSEEEKRQRTLDSYSILDTLPEDDYDFITHMASEICGTPISFISLIDKNRQWFKSEKGLGIKESSREESFCAHTINAGTEIFIVEDTRKDERFYDNPFVVNDPKLLFYAGVPFLSKDGLPLGTLCVMDKSPKTLSKKQIDALTSLSKQVMNLLELRKNKWSLEEAMQRLTEKNKALDRFAHVAAHDLKSPLNNIASLSNLFIEMHGERLSADETEIMEMIGSSSGKLLNLIDGLLEYSRSERLLKEEHSMIDIKDFVVSTMNLFASERNLTHTLVSSVQNINVNRTALEQIFINLLSNAIKYNDKAHIKIEIGISETEERYTFYLQDNGPGIAAKDQGAIFELFETVAKEDRYGKKGSGIGLSTVKRIIETLQGGISLQSAPGQGCKFIFELPKN
ncbi:MAG: GAF domain-containing sensor histidine kinase [Sediminicola sp.]